MTKANRISLAIIGSPLLWGSLATLGFYTLLETGIWQSELALRYFADSWVEYVETAAFFVGLAWLAIRAIQVRRQLDTIDRPILGTASPRDSKSASDLLEEFHALSESQRAGYLPRRLREALEAITRSGSADSLEDELKYLSELDAHRSHADYGILRLVIWAIPILGFLGTVIGITMAIASLSPKDLEQSLPEVTRGLGVAFDTTAIALAFSMVLMFVQFAVDKLESGLLAKVDQRAAAELAGRFEQTGAGNDPHLAVVRRMSTSVLKATERLVETQAEIWQSSLESAQRRWTDEIASAGRQIESAVASALGPAMQMHAQRLAEAAESAAELNRQHWNRFEGALAQVTASNQVQQAELSRQAEILLRVVEATGQVTRLEETLNRNLAALAGAQHFEETLLNLAGAIHLLNARLGNLASDSAQVDLGQHTPVSRAA